ncbi:transporter substrate-binding domain-containing protein [Roseospira navarrensis]|nr:transporter substrate-binding domain-containing protein [Roseospira navarrensis]
MLGLSVALVWGGPASADAAEPLVVGSELDYPPFSIVNDQGEPDGFAVELFRSVAEVMDLDATVRTGPWSDLLDDLRTGDLDALPFVGIFPERDAYLDFSVPVVVTRGTAFVRDDGPDVETDADLSDLRVAVMRDDVGHEYARAQPWGYGVVPFPTLRDAFDCLAVGECDAVVAPRLQGLLLLDREGRSGIQAADLDLEGFELRYAFAVREGDADLLATLNGGLAIRIADGTLDRLTDRWMPQVRAAQGIPLRLLLPYATGALVLVLALLLVLYLRQRAATRLAATRGRSLQKQADHLRQLAARLEAEKARAEAARAEADTLIRVMPDLFVRMDAEGRYIDFHDPERLLVTDADALRGQHYDEALPSDVAAAITSALDHMRATGETQTVEYQLALADGALRSFEARLAPYQDGGCLAVIRDVTDAREREARLTQAAMAIAGASAAKTRFLATMSHELRTPLNAILGFSEVMANEVFGPLGSRTYRDYARDIHDTGQSLMGLICDLMDISRIEAGKLTLSESVVDLQAILEHKAALLRADAAANGTDLRVHRGTPLHLFADEQLVQRMLLNLLSNAIKFSPDGQVTTWIDTEDPSGDVTLVVADTGIGMTADQLSHLGEPFYQADADVARHAGGIGLGVTLVTEMIALHGGTLHHQSQPGVGTTARLVFPRTRRLPKGVLAGPGLAKTPT